MKCQRCGSARVLEFSAKCSDMSNGGVGEAGWQGYVPRDIGVGGGDYIDIAWCLDCGQVQGEFPRPLTKMEQDVTA